MKEPAAEILEAAEAAYAEIPWEPEPLRERLEQIGTDFGLSLGKVQPPVRVAVTGRTVGLPLFESLHVLGREETVRRIVSAREQVTGIA
jgi:glutamyl-tRNA synthetase